MATKTIEPDIVDILKRGTLENGVYRLPEGQLDRKVYEKVAKVLRDHDAKWDKKAGGHTFGPMGVPERLLAAIESGKTSSLQQETQFFETPPEVVALLLELAELRPGLRCLEPSAGTGAIAKPLAKAVGLTNVDVCEIHLPFFHRLSADCFGVVASDFFFLDPDKCAPYDRVVMNPPFTRGADVKHVLHARRFLKPDGLLVSVMSAGWENREDRAGADFRELVEAKGEAHVVPDGAFKASGTGIETRIVVLRGEASIGAVYDPAVGTGSLLIMAGAEEARR